MSPPTAAFSCGCAALAPRRASFPAPNRRPRPRPRPRPRFAAHAASASEEDDPAHAVAPVSPPSTWDASPAPPRRVPPPPARPAIPPPALPLVTSVELNLNGRDALPSLASLMRYTNDLRPKLDYLEPKARERVLYALEVANVAHEGQVRKSGEPFIVHPIAVAAILAEMRMDRDCIVAGLLHDTVEDTPITLEELETLFGHDVRKIVEGETKLTKLAKKVHGENSRADADAAGNSISQFGLGDPNIMRNTSPNLRVPPWQKERQKREEEQQKQADNLRAMFMAMTEDVRVIIVKLADRLHNIRTLGHMSVEKQKKIAKETLEFFAPLAHRLGMRRIKSELEELSFKYLHPEEYQHLKYEVETLMTRSKFKQNLESAEAVVKEVLEQDRILYDMIRSVNVIGSTKELYSIYRRIQAGENLASMLDIATLLVVVDLDPGVDSNQACYHVLGRINALWKPLPRLKDYISFPKPNGYQSLHTTVLLGPKFDFLSMEIQIRTAEMHQIAEEGIAAELFKPGVGPKSFSLNQTDEDDAGHGSEWRRRTMGWLINIREYIEVFSSSKDLIDAVRKDLLGNRVFVFTPKGRIIDLPKDSTPVDVAYRIHSDVGNNMIGTKVNGRSVEFDYKLQNADVVRVISSPCSPGPSSEWIGYAKSRTARQKIRQFLRARDRGDMLGRGRRMLEDEARRLFEPIPSEAGLSELMPRLAAVVSAGTGIKDVTTIDDLYMTIAKDSEENRKYPLERTVLSILRDRRHIALGVPRLAETLRDTSADVDAGGDLRRTKESATIVLSPCCHPVRGDDIRGVRVQNGTENAVIVHRTRCQHIKEVEQDATKVDSVVKLRWAVRPRELGDVLLDTDSMEGLIKLMEGSSGAQGTSHESKEKQAVNQPVRVVTVARDCTGLLSYISGVLASVGTSIRSAVTLTNPETLMATFAFEVLVRDTYHLRQILERIEECDEVDSARRLDPNESQKYFPDGLCGSTVPRGGDNEDCTSLRLMREGQQVTWNELEVQDV